MEIRVKFDGAKWTVFPDPAHVKSGALIAWRFEATNLPSQHIRWTAYFDHGSPFEGQGNRFITTTESSKGEHTGTTGQFSADDPGDYKYGVRAEDSSEKISLGDDDPRLIVTRS